MVLAHASGGVRRNPAVRARVSLRGAFRSFAKPSVKELAELVIWGLLALVALVLVMIPGDQTAAGVDWLFKWFEVGP
jgi:hypothetical protein